MKKFTVLFLTLLIAVFGASTASATSSLWDWAFNLNGDVYYMEDSSTVPDLGDSSFDYNTGLGILTFSYYPGAVGDYFLLGIFDHEIDETINSLYNEYGATSGTPATGQSWEIDEPGYLFGDIYDHVFDRYVYADPGLDNDNNVPQGWEDDVSMALGWDFPLAALDVATIELILEDTAPTSGFYLSHTDPDSAETIYFSSTLDIQLIPEPGTMILLGTGLAGLAGLRRRKSKK